MTLSSSLANTVLATTKATGIIDYQQIQSLWGGYGQLLRIRLANADVESVIVKHIQLPHSSQNRQAHPKGWNTQLSHQRKVHSYEVEQYWYQHYANQCSAKAYVPQCLLTHKQGNEVLIMLEDLAASGFNCTHQLADTKLTKTCLTWLGQFHGQFMQHNAHGLWPTGTYWHLRTRPDELEAMADLRLKRAATRLDEQLNQCPFQTLVHGDAKLANFCFNNSGTQAAAVDFQYVGKGCGMKDVILLLSSTLCFNETPEQLEQYIAHYFVSLKQSLQRFHPHIDANAVEHTWRHLLPIAWADFQRFLKGWSPKHIKINSFTERMTEKALVQLGQ